MITIEKIKNIAEDIIADDGWVKDSYTQSEHAGIKAGLYALIHHLEDIIADDEEENYRETDGTTEEEV